MHHPITIVKNVFYNSPIISTLESTNRDCIGLLATHEIITRVGRVMAYIDLFVPFRLPKHSSSNSKDDTTPNVPTKKLSTTSSSDDSFFESDSDSDN